MALRILLVDDEEIVRKTITLYLVSSGHQVDNAIDSAQALELLAQETYEVALVDILMPGEMDGLSLLTRMREWYPRVKVIVITGHGDPEIGRSVQEQGAVGFFLKPFSLRKLGELLVELEECGG